MNHPSGRDLAKFSKKLHEFERIWTPGGGGGGGGACAPHTPQLDPPMHTVAVLGLRNAVAIRTPSLGTIVPICDFNF